MCWTRSNDVPSSSWYSSSTPSVYGSLWPNVWSSTLRPRAGPSEPLPVIGWIEPPRGCSCVRGSWPRSPPPPPRSRPSRTGRAATSRRRSPPAGSRRRPRRARARRSAPVRGVGDEHPRAHDVVDRGAGAVERLGDDREAEPRLLVGALRRRRAVWRDRRRAGDVGPSTAPRRRARTRATGSNGE